MKPDSASGYRFTAIATLTAAAAGITFLAGLVDAQLDPLISIRALPDAGWAQLWSTTAVTAAEVQSAAVQEWIRAVLSLLGIIMVMAGISALVSLFAHASTRRYEVALAAVVGASRRQLVRSQLQSAAVNSACALGLGVSAGLACAMLAQRVWPHVPHGLAAGLWMLAGVLFCVSLTGLVAYRVAARMARSGWLGDALAPESRANPGFGAEDLRGVLLQVQFAFTLALLCVALLVWQSARSATSDPAWTKAGYLTRVEMAGQATEPERREILRAIDARAGSNAGHAIASPGAVIGIGKLDHVMAVCGRCVIANMILPIFKVRAQQHAVSANFFTLVGDGVAQGRTFDQYDAAQRQIVVNDTFASLAFQGQDPIGKRVQVGGFKGPWYTVIGVVRDLPITGLMSFRPDELSVVRNRRLGHEPAIYFNAEEKLPVSFDLLTSAEPAGLGGIAGTRAEPPQSMASVVADARAPSRWFASLLAALAVAAAVLALLSLFAVTMLNVRQREHEFAARRAVGARRADIIRLVLRDSFTTLARAGLVGAILSVAIARAMQMILPQMRVLDFNMLIGAATLLAAVSLVAAALPAHMAAAIPPARMHA